MADKTASTSHDAPQAKVAVIDVSNVPLPRAKSKPRAKKKPTAWAKAKGKL
jgi:hypothetical protein